MRFLSTLSRVCELLVPSACAACGAPGQPLCDGCRRALRGAPEPRCARCDHPQSIAVPTCPQCPRTLDTCRQAVVYDGPAAAMVAALKDQRRIGVARLVADEMSIRLCRPDHEAVLVPVPLGRRRAAERGFNQAEAIASPLADRWELSVATDLLVRRRVEPSQRGATADARARQASGAFHAPEPVPRHVVIIDDVHTTGATLAACAVALRRAGARRIDGFAFARAVRRP
jgi:ComF family protein